MKSLIASLLVLLCYVSIGLCEHEQNETGWYEYTSKTLGTFHETLSDYWNSSQKWMKSINTGMPCHKFVCPLGHKLIRNTTVPDAHPNGCGSYGLLIPREYTITLSGCCDEHDHCYTKCGTIRGKCDKVMRACHLKACKTLLGAKHYMLTTCKTMARQMFRAVRNFGCLAFRATQEDQCYCQKNR